jgi:hypothetical protein
MPFDEEPISLTAVRSEADLVAIDIGLRPGDAIQERREMEDQGSWAASRKNVSRLETEDNGRLITSTEHEWADADRLPAPMRSIVHPKQYELKVGRDAIDGYISPRNGGPQYTLLAHFFAMGPL